MKSLDDEPDDGFGIIALAVAVIILAVIAALALMVFA